MYNESYFILYSTAILNILDFKDLLRADCFIIYTSAVILLYLIVYEVLDLFFNSFLLVFGVYEVVDDFFIRLWLIYSAIRLSH